MTAPASSAPRWRQDGRLRVLVARSDLDPSEITACSSCGRLDGVAVIACNQDCLQRRYGVRKVTIAHRHRHRTCGTCGHRWTEAWIEKPPLEKKETPQCPQK